MTLNDFYRIYGRGALNRLAKRIDRSPRYLIKLICLGTCPGPDTMRGLIEESHAMIREGLLGQCRTLQGITAMELLYPNGMPEGSQTQGEKRADSGV